MNIQLTLLLLTILIATNALAVGDECINELTPNAKNFCLAKQYANVTKCDAITSVGMKTECISVVKTKQRDSMWSIKPIDIATADVRGDKKYIWQHH